MVLNYNAFMPLCDFFGLGYSRKKIRGNFAINSGAANIPWTISGKRG